MSDNLTDEARIVLWAACHLVQGWKPLALSSVSMRALAQNMSVLPFGTFQKSMLRSGIQLGLVSPLDLKGFG